MQALKQPKLIGGFAWLAACLAYGLAIAENGNATAYPAMAPIAQYRMASRTEEIALARSAAPGSISGDAEILVLGERGYEVAVKGKNRFVCLVERSWLASFDDPVFWNFKIRAPDCLNPAAARTVLPGFLLRTQWVLQGKSVVQMKALTQSESEAHQAPAPGAMGYMLSKQGYITDGDGHWHPHLMLFQSHASLADWGANLPGSPLLGQEGGPGEATVLFIPVSAWSDGTPAAMN
jgi:hypothetical protein